MTLTRNSFLRWGPYLLVGAFACLHWAMLWRFVVDVPHWDEWEMIPGLQRAYTQHDWRWFVEPLNEHLMVLAKAQIYLSYLWTGWNFRNLQLVNFGFYLFTLLSLWWFAKNYLPSVRAPQFLFFLFPLMPLAWENHSMAFQINVHLMLFLVGWAGWLLFCRPTTWGTLLSAASVNFLSTINVSSGAVLVLVLVAVHTVWVLDRVRRNEEVPSQWRSQLAVSLGLHALILWAFMLSSRNTAHSGVLTSLLQLDTWNYFLHLIVFAFGFDGWKGLSAYSQWLAFPLLVFLVAPFWILRRRLTAAQWALMAWTLGLVAVALLIASARHMLGLEGARSSRYFEFVGLLVPLSAFSWSEALTPWPELRKRALVGIGLFVFLAFADDWNFHAYRVMADSRARSLRCAFNLVNGISTEPICPEASPNPLPPYLKAASELDLHFLRD